MAKIKGYGFRSKKPKKQTLDDTLKKRDAIEKDMHVCRHCKHAILDQPMGEWKCKFYQRRPKYSEQEIDCVDFAKGKPVVR